MVSEVYFRINKLIDDTRVDVTTTAQQIFDMYAFDRSLMSEVKTIELTNNSANDIYFGKDNTVTVSNSGGLLKAGSKMEIPMTDLNYSPYFIASGTSELLLLFWG